MKKLTPENRDALRKTVRMLRRKHLTEEWVSRLFMPTYCFLCQINMSYLNVGTWDSACGGCPLYYERHEYIGDDGKPAPCTRWRLTKVLFDMFETFPKYIPTDQIRKHKLYPEFKAQCYKVADWLEERFLKEGKL